MAARRMPRLMEHTTMPRTTMELNGPWRMHPDESDKGELLGWHAADCDDSHWLAANVPCAAEDCHPDMHTWIDSAWFRRRFHVPADWADKYVVIRFESVTDHCDVYLNGTKIGSHGDGYLRFDVPTGAALRPGAENVLAVRVDNRFVRSDVPGYERGWRTYAGILRDVYAIATDRLRVADAWVVAEPGGKGGRFELHVQAANEGSQAAAADIVAEVTDAGGKVLATLKDSAGSIGPGGSVERVLKADVAGVQPWSPDSPTLYSVRIALHRDGKAVDSHDVRFGFRKIEARGHEILLNGRPIFLTGFNRHEDSPRTGLCPDFEIVEADLRGMKAAGANFVRLCHYPHHPGEMDLCDEIGLLVMCEIPLYWWRGYEFGEEVYKTQRANAKRQLTKMILRDRNHPSVIFWSVSNETHEGKPEVAAGNAELTNLAREIDPTRFATHVCSWWYTNFNFAADDVICVNSYPSNHLDCWANLPADDNDAMNTQPRLPEPDFEVSKRFWREKLAAVHERFPDKPIVITEFGHVGLRGVRGGHNGEDRQAKVIEQETQGMTAPYLRGMTIWCWADHLWHEGASRHSLSISPYGILTRRREPKMAMETVKRIFTERQKRG